MKNAGVGFHKSSRVYLVSTSILLCALLCVPAGFGQSPPKTWAVIIGISKYPGLPGGQQLQFAERDAQSFATALLAAGIGAANMKLLVGPQANLSGIKEALGSWLARSAGPQDTAIIFFSGHGYVEQAFGEAYLLAEDSNLQNVFATGLSLADIKHIVEARIRAARVVILQDSIRKDLFNPDSDGPGLTEAFFNAAGEIAASKTNTSVIIASSPGEFSWEGRRWGEMGVFTKTLVEGMAGRADRNGDGAVTDGELFRFLSDQVPTETSGKQHPWRSSTPVTEAVLSRSQATGPRMAATAPRVDTSVTRKRGPVQNEPAAPGEPVAAAAPTTTDRSALSPPPDQAPAGRAGTPLSGASPKVQPGVTARPATPQPPTTTDRSAISSPPDQPGVAARPPTPQPPTTSDRSAVSSQPDQTGVAARPAAAQPGATSQLSNQPDRPQNKPISRASQPSVVPGKTTAARSLPVPPTVAAAEPIGPGSAPGAPVAGIGTREAPAPPKPAVLLPNPGSIAASPEVASRTGPVGPLSVEAVGVTPSPLVLQLELALNQGSLVSPAGSSAWDLYQKLTAVEPQAKELPALKSVLIDALLARSKAIVAGDVRGDNISSNVDDFRLAGQMLVRLRSFQPDNPDITTLQKLSAAEALIALQFYDEAARALEPLRTPSAGWVENALGLTAAGQLSDYEAERHFKRAIELEPKWAAPHYNLALLYRNQKKEAGLAEFEQAARLDASNPAILTALGDEYFERKQWNEAASAYREALRTRPDDDALHTKLGHSLYSQGLRSEADKEYQKAKELAGRKK